MPLTETQRIACEDYVLRKSWRCQRMPQRSRRLVRHCLNLIPLAEQRQDGDVWLLEQMRAESRLRVKNPAIIWLILQWVLPVLIRLVVEWWLDRNRQQMRSKA